LREEAVQTPILKSRIFHQCLLALEAENYPEVERLLQGLDLCPNEPRAVALANQIRALLVQRTRACAIPETIQSEDRSRIEAQSGTLSRPRYRHREGHADGDEKPIRDGAKKFLLSSLNDVATLPGISLVVGCMNREENLQKVLPSWLATNADEIIIVDWSSRSEIWPMVARIDDARVKVVRIDGESKWILSHALNVGLRFARRDLVFKVDSDIALAPDFFAKNQLRGGEFVRGFWKAGLEHGGEGQQYINGTFGAYKKDLRQANYYDERIVTYGWDDSDLYIRLGHDLGLAGRQIDPGTLCHIDQTEQQRIENQAVGGNKFLGGIDATTFEGTKNKFYTAIAGSWAAYSGAQDYVIAEVYEGYFRGARVTHSSRPNPEYVQLAETLAARQLAEWGLSSMPGSGEVAEISIEFARLLLDAQKLNRSQTLIDGLDHGSNLIFVSSERGACSFALTKTLEVLHGHYPSFSERLVIADDTLGPLSDTAQALVELNVLYTSRGLLDRLVSRADSRALKGIGELPLQLASGERGNCHLELAVSSLVDEAMEKATKVPDGLAGFFEPSETQVTNSCLVTSLYDEQNLLRLFEYLACLILNLRVFQRVVVCYESSTCLL
jgi:hypothetical protein